MKDIYIVFYDRINNDDYDDCYDAIIDKIFVSEESAIKYCNSVGEEKYSRYICNCNELNTCDNSTINSVTYEYYYRKYTISEEL